MVVKSINCKTKSLQKKNLRWYLIPNQIEYFLKPFLKVLNKMREIIGFHLGDSILAPGGSISNMYALIIARHRYYPNHKHHGMRAILEHLIVYTSEEVSFISIKHSEKNYCYTIILFVKLTWSSSTGNTLLRCTFPTSKLGIKCINKKDEWLHKRYWR